ncbi:FG-GAP-like repeat-containing protein [Streptomyces sp. NPDC001744]|uniref:FG-GAP-like repeat-containing protein n=1 Tax=Streptomyces sp. NPDC001744 TaxID=3364606 RepID=UPI003697B37C
MSRVRTHHRRLAAAVVAVAAVTGLAAPAAAVPAAGTGAAATTPEERTDVARIPSGTVLVGSGPQGFLAKLSTASGSTYSWTRYADGTTTALPPGTYLGGDGTDLVVTSAGGVHTLHDPATGAAPVVVDTTALGPDAVLHRLTGSTLVLSRPTPAGGTEVHLAATSGGTAGDRRVTGLPENARVSWFGPSSPGTLILTYAVAGTPGQRLALVDVASAAVVEDRATGGDTTGGTAASATHAVWTERSGDGRVTLAAVRRGDTAAEPERVALGTGAVQLAPLGDWVLYGVAPGEQFDANPLHGLTARSLSTGKTVRLLDNMRRFRVEGADRVLAQGGTAERGEGLYRIAPGPDGTPVATFVASDGNPTAIGVETRAVPGVVDIGRNDATWRWVTNRGNAEVRFRVTHVASGKSWNTEPEYLGLPSAVGRTWTGMFDNRTSAHNGDYTWQMTVRPTDGIGPALVRTGTFRAVSAPAPHDFSDSGAPDLLVRDSTGRLIGYDARQTLYETGHWGRPSQRERTDHGTGWNQYDLVTVPGNVGGPVHADVLGRDRAGVLWLHQGTGKGFAPRTRIGGGWQTYNRLAGGSDLTGDGRADLVATDKAGDLYLYKGTGNASAPFGARQGIGVGWGIYDRITATGNIAGAAAGDLVARDRDGVLWLYLGKGDGTYAPRIRVGTGWNRYSDIVGVGDVNRDGRPDLVTQGVMGGTYETLSFYLGTGDYRRPFGSRQEVYNPEELGTGDVTLF